jgi:hypothetical protein
VFPDLEPVRFIERPAGYRSLSGAPLCGEPICTHIFSQMLRAAYGTGLTTSALQRGLSVVEGWAATNTRLSKAWKLIKQ